MLRDFIIANRQQIIDRARVRSHERTLARPDDVKLANGVPLFLTQLADVLALESTSASTPAASTRADTAITDTAELHGQELLRNGLTVAQVVHGYGDVCQVVTEMASELESEISADDFHVFNRCLDFAIAGAVTAFGRQRERDVEYRGTERLGVLAHELRNLLQTATMSFAVIKQGVVGLDGRTAAVHGRTLAGLSVLVDRSLAEIRIEAGAPRRERLSVREFLEDIEVVARMQAEGHGVNLRVEAPESDAVVEADRQLLSSALLNLLQNAFKFTHPHSNVSLWVDTTDTHVVIEVADECGGLPADKSETLFRPFTQAGDDRSGLGLGLSIARSAVQANQGQIRVHDVPGKGCVFGIELPRHR